MASMIGADPAQLKALGGRMATAADDLDRIRTTITSMLTNSHWVGHDAEAFRHDWHARLAGRLTGAAIVARQAATTLHTQADEQLTTSQAHNGWSAGGGGVHAMGDRATALGPFALFPLSPVFLADVLDKIRSTIDGLGTAADKLRHLKDNLKVPDELRALGRHVDEFFRANPVLGRVDDLVKWAKGPFTPLVALVEIKTLIEEYNRDPDSAATFNAVVNTTLGVAAVAAVVVCAVISAPVTVPLAVIGGMGLAFTAITTIDAELPKRVFDGVSDAAKDAWHDAGRVVDDAVDDVTDGVKGAADAAKDFFEGGVDSVKGLF